MENNKIPQYTQELLDKIISLSREIENLKAAYIITTDRLNSLSLDTHKKSLYFAEDINSLKEIADLCSHSCEITHQLAMSTKINTVIDSAKKSYEHSQEVLDLAIKCYERHQK